MFFSSSYSTTWRPGRQVGVGIFCFLFTSFFDILKVMIITYFGKQFFKITQGDLTIALNPVGRESRLAGQVPRFGADIALSSVNHPDYNGSSQMSHGERQPLSINSPGEYEVHGVLINGFSVPTEIDGKKYLNTIFSFKVDEMNLCFLGALKNTVLPAEVLEELDSPDVLFIPLGTLAPATVYKLATTLEAKLVIPMDYDDKSLKMFLKEAGAEDQKPEEKLMLKRKDLEEKDGDVVVLTPARQ